VRIQVERLTPPAPLLVCLPAPAPPDPATVGDVAAADYVIDLWSAGEDCRDKLGRVRAWTNATTEEAPEK